MGTPAGSDQHRPIVPAQLFAAMIAQGMDKGTQLADASGVSDSTISQLLKGRSGGSPETQQLLADTLHTTVENLTTPRPARPGPRPTFDAEDELLIDQLCRDLEVGIDPNVMPYRLQRTMKKVLREHRDHATHGHT